VRLLHGCRVFLCPEINEQILSILNEYVFKKLKTLKGKALKDIPKELLKKGMNQIYTMYCHIRPASEYRLPVEKFRFDVYRNFIESEYLDKQVLD